MKYLLLFLLIGEMLACNTAYIPRSGDHLTVKRIPATSTFKTDNGYLIDVVGCTRVPPDRWTAAHYANSEDLVIDDGDVPYVRCPIKSVRPYIQVINDE